MSSVPQRLYSDIIRDLEELDAYLTKLGLRRAQDRLHRMISNLKELERARAEDRLLALNTHPKVAEFVFSLVEGQELTDIFRGIRKYDPEVVKPLMRRALKGPLNPAEETTSSNSARNTIFELTLGVRFRGAGADTTFGQRADLVIAHAGSCIYVECKRPLYEHTIEENVKKARRQLRQRFDSDPCPDSTAGLVAVSISKTITQGTKWLMVNDATHIQPTLSNDVRNVHEQYSGDFDDQIDPRLIGMMYHVIAPVFIRNTGLLIAASQIDIFMRSNLRVLFPISGKALENLLKKLKPPS